MKLLAIGYVLAIHALLGVVLVKPWVGRMLTGLPDPVIAKTHRVNLARDPFVPPGSVVFLGDSHTHRLYARAVTPDAVNYGISSQTAADLARYVPEYQAVRNARAIVLTIGANDRGEPDYEAVLAVLPDVPLLWNGVIGRSNARIRQLCQQRPRCTYLAPPPADVGPDGVHLTEDSYRKWIEALRDGVEAVNPDVAAAVSNVLTADTSEPPSND